MFEVERVETVWVNAIRDDVGTGRQPAHGSPDLALIAGDRRHGRHHNERGAIRRRHHSRPNRTHHFTHWTH
jgi:hypothetical protein